jgi:hypothetical protein
LSAAALFAALDFDYESKDDPARSGGIVDGGGWSGEGR